MRTVWAHVRSIFTWVTAVPATLAIAAAVWVWATVRPTSPTVENLVRFWGRTCMWLAGVRLTVVGLDNVDTDRSYVVVSNHLSGFDIMAHFAGLPIPIRFLAKTELFKIPIFGRAMRSIGIVEVDRGAGRSIHEHINTTATDAVAKGRSLIIYPEGTRPRDGQLGRFKKGAFTIATAMDLPVLPTAIVGSYEVWAPESKVIRPGEITITVMPPIETTDMGPKEVDGLRSEVRGLIDGVVTAPQS